MLHILSQPFFKSGEGIGKVLEFAGDGVRAMPLDERATLTNMAVEAGGFTGIIEADEVVVDYLVKQRGLDADDVRARIVTRRRGRDVRRDVRRRPRRRSSRWSRRPAIRATACRCATLARRGRRRARSTSPTAARAPAARRPTWTCTRRSSARAVAQGKRVADGVHLYIQFGSQDIRRYAEAQGYLEIFAQAGRRARRPVVRRLHQGRARASRTPPDQVTVSRDQPQFPGPQRARARSTSRARSSSRRAPSPARSSRPTRSSSARQKSCQTFGPLRGRFARAKLAWFRWGCAPYPAPASRPL